MVILPFVFLIQPLIQIFATPGSASGTLRHEHSLIYMLAIPHSCPPHSPPTPSSANDPAEQPRSSKPPTCSPNCCEIHRHGRNTVLSSR